MKGKIDYSQVEQVAYQQLRYKTSLHGWEHMKRVVDYAKKIAKELCPGLIDDVVIAACFHDVGRISDGGGNEHAFESAKIAEEIIPKYWPGADLKSILFAIKHHSDIVGEKGGDPVIYNYNLPPGVKPEIAMCLWDADRLDLPRILPADKIVWDYLHSSFAKSFAGSEEHRKMYS